MTLRDMAVGSCCKILSVGGEGALRQHLLDMGVLPGGVCKVVGFAPMGDPMEIQIYDYELTLRLADAEKIIVEETTEMTTAREIQISKDSSHPGYGEEGKYHLKSDGTELPKDTILTFALAGNQNCGKTTLFNQLTGANQHVGNFPGVTVDKKDGPIREHSDTLVTDLPGIYSLSPYSSD